MPHSRCTPCHARVWREASPAGSPPDLCPGCGGELEAVGALSELVGLKALRVRPRAEHRDPAGEFERISRQIRDALAAHDTERERDKPSTAHTDDPGADRGRQTGSKASPAR